MHPRLARSFDSAHTSRNFHLVSASVMMCGTFLALNGCSSSHMGIAPSGGAAPAIVGVGLQVNGSAPNRKQEVQFSQAMDASTVNGQSFQIADSNGNLAQGIVTYDPNFNIASFQPSPALQAGSAYTATITTAVASAGGVHLASAYSYPFTVRAEDDKSPLSVNTVDPGANAICVSATTPITITFNEAPDPATLTAQNFAVTGPGGAISVKISTNVTTTQVVLTPTAALPTGTISVSVSNVADLAGVKMVSGYMWSFSTACGSGGGGTGTTQYSAPLYTPRAGRGTGLVTVDATGKVTVQVNGGGTFPNQALTAQFCEVAPPYGGWKCFPVGALTTDMNGNANMTAQFPKPGSWVGKFQLVRGAGSPGPEGFSVPYETGLGPNYFATLQPAKIMDEGILATSLSNVSQAPLKNGTVSFMASPGTYGSMQFTLTGAPPNTGFNFVQGYLVAPGSGTYEMYDSNRNGYFVTDSQGNLSASVLVQSISFDTLSADPVNDARNPTNQAGYFDGFFVP